MTDKPNAIEEIMMNHVESTLVAGGLNEGMAKRIALEIVRLQIASLSSAGLKVVPEAVIWEARRDSLFSAIEHGDQEHREWLAKAINDHFSGRAVERPQGKGPAERIAELEAENKRLRQAERTLDGIYDPSHWETEAQES